MIDEIREELGSGDTGGIDFIMFDSVVTFFSDIYSKVSGILFVLILVSVTLVIGVEFAYINAFKHSLLRDRGSSKKARAFSFIMRDAIRAVRIANTEETGRDVNLVYLGLKIKKLFLVCLLSTLLLGGFGTLYDFVLNLSVGVRDMIAGLV